MTRRFASDQPLQAQSINQLLDLGFLGLQLGYDDQAESYFDAVLERVPDHPRALIGKAKACHEPEIALAAVRHFLAIRPANREARQLESELRELVKEDETATDPLAPIITSVTSDTGSGALPEGTEMTLALAPSRSEPPSPKEPIIEEESPTVEGLARLRHALRKLLQRHLATVIIGLFLIAAGLGIYFGVAHRANRSITATREAAQVEYLVFGQESIGEDTPADHVAPVPTAVADALGRAARATAMLTVPSVDGALYQGSGIILTADGLVLTNYHVMTGSSKRLANPEGQAFVGLTIDERKPPSEWYIATAVVLDEQRDLCILRMTHTAEGMPIKGDHFVPLERGHSQQLRLGQSIMGLGFPALGGDTLTLTRGSMAGYLYSNDVQWGKTDSELLPGSSGGAVLDDQGCLIGVITLVQADESTKGRLSYFMLLHEAQTLIDQAMRAPRPNLDVSGMIVRYATLRDTMP